MEQARPLCRGCGQKVLTEIEAIEYDGDGRPWHHFCMDQSEEDGAVDEIPDSWVQDELDRMD